MSIAEIMEKYKAGEITLDEANAELIGVEAGFHLTPLTDEERAAKNAKEDAEGYFKPEDRGFEPKPVYPEAPDMRRNKEKAGTSEVQLTKRGKYEVFYGEDGYATKAVRL